MVHNSSSRSGPGAWTHFVPLRRESSTDDFLNVAVLGKRAPLTVISIRSRRVSPMPIRMPDVNGTLRGTRAAQRIQPHLRNLVRRTVCGMPFR
jgi:hypothetical protein